MVAARKPDAYHGADCGCRWMRKTLDGYVETEDASRRSYVVAMTTKPRVINVRHAVSSGFKLVDRTTEWGNVHRCRPNDDERRAEVIRVHRRLIAESWRVPEYRERLQRELKGEDLGCHCAPLPCHATTLIAVANCGGLLD